MQEATSFCAGLFRLFAQVGADDDLCQDAQPLLHLLPLSGRVFRRRPLRR